MLDYIAIALIIYLAYRNSLIAKLKGKSPTVWAVMTLVAYFVFYMIGIIVVMVIMVRSGQISAAMVQNIQKNNALTAQLMNVLQEHPIHVLTIEAFGLGGYLLVRYILERMPIKNMPKDHEGVV